MLQKLNVNLRGLIYVWRAATLLTTDQRLRKLYSFIRYYMNKDLPFAKKITNCLYWPFSSRDDGQPLWYRNFYVNNRDLQSSMWLYIMYL